MLTEKQEMWSDSIDYYRAKDHVILRRDIQIDDTEHKVLAFGDYGEYWKEPGDAFLTRRPAIVSYDLSQGDSLFMRADSMFLFTVNENARRRAAEADKTDSLTRLQADSAASERPDSVAGGGLAGDSAALAASGHGPQKDGVPDSLASAAAGPGTAASAGADSLGAAHPGMPEGAVDSL